MNYRVRVRFGVFKKRSPGFPFPVLHLSYYISSFLSLGKDASPFSEREKVSICGTERFPNVF